MTNNMNKLYEFKNKFKSWDKNRIKSVYNRLLNGDVCTFQTISLESSDHNVTEIQRVKTYLDKSNHFEESQSLDSITQYIFYWWDNIQSLLTIDNKKDEYTQFKKWFENLLSMDFENKGMAWNNLDHFILEWEEITNESFGELFELLSAEGIG